MSREQGTPLQDGGDTEAKGGKGSNSSPINFDYVKNIDFSTLKPTKSTVDVTTLGFPSAADVFTIELK